MKTLTYKLTGRVLSATGPFGWLLNNAQYTATIVAKVAQRTFDTFSGSVELSGKLDNIRKFGMNAIAVIPEAATVLPPQTVTIDSQTIEAHIERPGAGYFADINAEVRDEWKTVMIVRAFVDVQNQSIVDNISIDGTAELVGATDEPEAPDVPGPVDPPTGLHTVPTKLTAEIPVVWGFGYCWYNALDYADTDLASVRKAADECGIDQVAIMVNLSGALGIPKSANLPNTGTDNWKRDYEAHIVAFNERFFPLCEKHHIGVVADFENGNNMTKGYRDFRDTKRDNILFYYRMADLLKYRVDSSPWFLAMLVWSEASKSGLGAEEAHYTRRYVSGLESANNHASWPMRMLCGADKGDWAGDQHTENPKKTGARNVWITSDTGPAVQSLFGPGTNWDISIPKVDALKRWAVETHRQGRVSRVYNVAPQRHIHTPENQAALREYLTAWKSA